MLDAVEIQEKLIGMALWLAAELPAVVREDGAHGYAQGLVEGLHAAVQQVARGDRHLRGEDLGEGQGAEHVHEYLDVDLAHTLEAAPVERVLVEELAGPAGLDVSAAEVHAVTLEELDLLLAEDEGRLLRLPLEAQQALVAGLEVVAHPDPAHAARADLDVLHAELVGHPHATLGREVEGVGQDLLLDLLGDAVGMRAARAALLEQKRGCSSRLEGPSHLVEGVAVVSHEAAGLGDVTELLGEFERRELPSGTLGQGRHRSPPW